jgi:hypothetical protein
MPDTEKETSARLNMQTPVRNSRGRLHKRPPLRRVRLRQVSNVKNWQAAFAPAFLRGKFGAAFNFSPRDLLAVSVAAASI